MNLQAGMEHVVLGFAALSENNISPRVQGISETSNLVLKFRTVGVANFV